MKVLFPALLLAATAGARVHGCGSGGATPSGEAVLSSMSVFGAENAIDPMWHAWFFDGSAK